MSKSACPAVYHCLLDSRNAIPYGMDAARSTLICSMVDLLFVFGSCLSLVSKKSEYAHMHVMSICSAKSV